MLICSVPSTMPITTTRRLAFALLFCALAPLAQAAEKQAQLTQAERLVVERSNAFRQSQGVAPVAPERMLTAAAQAFAAYMARTDNYGHEADGREPSQRAQAQGYSYCMVAENIAMQYSSLGFDTEELARSMVQGWIDSPGHRHNLLAPEATDIGVGLARSASSGRYYAVQMFGRPSTLLLKFSLNNRSRVALNYQLDDKRYALPPGMTRTHEQCNTPALSVTVPGEAETVVLKPANGTRYRFEPSGRGVKVMTDN
jgi:uncharacterized protein YkwD